MGGWLIAVRGWLIDVLVGWVVGSALGAAAIGLIAAASTNDDDAIRAASTAGVVAGTIAGIFLMRLWRRARRRSAPPRA